MSIWKRLSKLASAQKNVFLNYSAGENSTEDLKKLNDLIQDKNEGNSLSNYQRGIANKYINIIIVTDKELLPDLIDKLKKL